MRPSEHDRPDIALARTEWHAEAPGWEPAHLVFLDETGVATGHLGRGHARGHRAPRVPTLHPGDCVIADTLSVHKVAGVRLAIERVEATLVYLPPYSPDLNPIELCFAKLKAIVRAARCRSIETLWPLLWECVPRSAPTNAGTTSGIATTPVPHVHENCSKVTVSRTLVGQRSRVTGHRLSTCRAPIARNSA